MHNFLKSNNLSTARRKHDVLQSVRRSNIFNIARDLAEQGGRTTSSAEQKGNMTSEAEHKRGGTTSV